MDKITKSITIHLVEIITNRRTDLSFLSQADI